MAQPKLDEREVRKARVALSQDGQKKAEARFGKNSPELKAAMQARRQRLAAQRSRVQDNLQDSGENTTNTNKKGRTMNQQNEKQKQQSKQRAAAKQQQAAKQQPPAAQRAQGAQRTDAQKRAVAMRKRQAQQNARNRERSQGQSQGQGM